MIHLRRKSIYSQQSPQSDRDSFPPQQFILVLIAEDTELTLAS
ncbi:MAG: hypothetical protein AAFY63_08065 [Cyanobacteria bacterium J06643_13]